MRCVLIFVAHFAPLEFSRSHWAVSVHGFLYQVGRHAAEFNLMANLLSSIFEFEFDLATHVACLFGLQVLAIIVILSSNDILDKL